MSLHNGSLRLYNPSLPHGKRRPIDSFFSSLASELQERSIAIILSGTGNDGTVGVQAIKEAGGFILVQDPATCEYDGMPKSAIMGTSPDFTLPPAEMIKHLLDHATQNPETINTAAPATLHSIITLLRAHTRHDFSQYKTSTLYRRIERRKAISACATLADYFLFLQENPTEVDTLFRDLLIGVTHFFRDPAAFQVLEERIIPALISSKAANSSLRIWVPGCSTGEEAYSLAILVHEQLEAQGKNLAVQIFATDIDRLAIEKARIGVFALTISASIAPQRLARYFTQEPDGQSLRIVKRIRTMLVFSEQDMIKDPPFSHLDLISCRNLLIYLDAILQKRIIQLFHYALCPGGTLFLGSAETVGDCNGMFSTLDRNAKLFTRLADSHRNSLANQLSYQTLLPAPETATPRYSDPSKIPIKKHLRELTEQTLLQKTAPAAALVTATGDILYIYGRTGLFLEPAPGETGVNNILQMAREGLRNELTLALHSVAETRQPAHRPGLNITSDNLTCIVHLAIHALPVEATAEEAPLYLVILELATEHSSLIPQEEANAGTEMHIATLRRELQTQDEFLRASNKELEAVNDELLSANESMQSMNEELQSSNEELETSKEELHSVNEELITVNNELQARITDLSRANNDMNNLLAGTGIGSLFLDHQLHILRFTPAVQAIINLIASDIGRPVSHLAFNLVGYDHLLTDIQTVLDTLVPMASKVQTLNGKWYSLRIQPYRTLDNVIEGAVISFVDISEYSN